MDYEHAAIGREIGKTRPARQRERSMRSRRSCTRIGRGARTPAGSKLKEVIRDSFTRSRFKPAIGGKILRARAFPRYGKRDREMLRRRYHSQTEIAGETKGRKKTNESHREDQHSSGSVIEVLKAQ